MVTVMVMVVVGLLLLLVGGGGVVGQAGDAGAAFWATRRVS